MSAFSFETLSPYRLLFQRLKSPWLLVPALFIWWLIYHSLLPTARWITYKLLGLPQGSHAGASVEFFLYEVPKVLMLLMVVVFGVGIVRTFFTPERTRAILAGKRESVGNVLAALLGIVTPFCSCSAVPLFLGFVQSGVPLGVTFSFLIAAPMINEVAVVLLLGMFGWKITAIYIGAGLAVAITAGWVIGRLRMERHLEPWVIELLGKGGSETSETRQTWQDRMQAGVQAVREIAGRVWLFVVIGIAIGAGIHGYVPTNALAGWMGKENWWSVPLAALLGVPMYSNAAGIVPVVQALLGKGAALGTALAFMMSVIALSLPEMIILRRVLRPRLIALFIGVVAFGIICVGFLFNRIL
jgi:uncharacterized membrane protein YraQ (UPF0718 family)